MNHELSFARAIWWGDCYLGTWEPTETVLFKHNMDVDYWFTRQCNEWLDRAWGAARSEVDIAAWVGSMEESGAIRRAKRDLADSRDVRDVWFFGPPAWLPPSWRDQCTITAHA